MRSWWLVLLGVILLVGCGANAPKRAAPATSKVDATPARIIVGAASGEAKSADAPPSAQAIQRKIVYRATVELVVENFDPVQSRVERLVKEFDAYLARSAVSGTPGTPRSGRWTIRVPADRYEAFLDAAREVGEVRRVSSDSQDVTEEFYDVEARIRNKKQEEARLLKLLETATGKLEEVLAVERETARVRGEIEQAEGRMRVLSDLTTLATIELQVDEIKNYVSEESATYATRVRRALDASLASLFSTAQQLSIAGVAMAPWIAVLLVPGLPLLLWVRARHRRKRGQPAR
jgi:hypothetical protein